MPSFPTLGIDPWWQSFKDLWNVAHNDDGTLKSGAPGTSRPYTLVYDTTGVADAAPLLQIAIDAGYRFIILPEGTFFWNTSVFDDLQDGNSILYLFGPGCRIKLGTGLNTVAEWDTFKSARSLPTGTKWALFSSTLRTARSAVQNGVVTCNNNFPQGTASQPVARIGVSPHLVVEGLTVDGSALTKYNGGFAFGNVGGAIETRSCHADSLRVLHSWWGYVDGNKMSNVGAWGAVNMDATYDAAPFQQINSGDAVYINGVKTDNYIRACKLFSCNAAKIESIVGGGPSFELCHGIKVISNHSEVAANIQVVPRIIYDIQDSHVEIDTSFDYAPESQPTLGSIYVNDTGSEGKETDLILNNYFGRHYMSGSVTDPGPGYDIFLNKMSPGSRIGVHKSWAAMSPAGSFAPTYGRMGLSIGGNATNEPTLAAAVDKARDIIGSGSYDIIKTLGSAVPGGSPGHFYPMNIEIVQPGAMAGIYRSRLHQTPTFYDFEGAIGPPGTLTSGAGVNYALAAAVCNTLPDGSVQYGQVTTEFLQNLASGTTFAIEIYTPTGGYGATLVVWWKLGTGVLSAPDKYVKIPIGSAKTRLLNTGTNINEIPWITTSVPVPNTVAATNHTEERLYVNGVAMTLP